MSKNRVLGLGILGFMLTMFNIIVFIAPFLHTIGFWFCYGFSMFAILVQVLIIYLGVVKAYTIKSKFIGVAIVYIGYIYLIMQLIFGLLFMALPMIPVWISVMVQVLILGGSAICLIATESGKDEINKVEKKAREKVLFIESQLIEIECLISKSNNTLVKKKLIELRDVVKYSDPMSNDSLNTIETKIVGKFEELMAVIEIREGDFIGKIIDETKQLFEQRNKKCKLTK